MPVHTYASICARLTYCVNREVVDVSGGPVTSATATVLEGEAAGGYLS